MEMEKRTQAAIIENRWVGSEAAGLGDLDRKCQNSRRAITSVIVPTGVGVNR
jgi:hypothetical protein